MAYTVQGEIYIGAMFYIKKNLIFILVILLIFTAVVFTIVRNNRNFFDVNQFRSSEAMDIIKELSSRDYDGRLAGTVGNELALQYIEDFFEINGISPAGEDGTYFQKFKTLMPDINKDPVFTISAKDGSVIQDYEMFIDYNAITDMNGGSIDYEGELLLVGQNILRIDPDFIKGRIVVVTSSFLRPDNVQYVMENGGLGILCAADGKLLAYSRYFEQEKSLNAAGKTGDSILAGYISRCVYQALEENMIEVQGDDKTLPDGIVPYVKLKVDIEFPIVETANVLGKIDGRVKNGRYLLITANLDSAGEGEGIKYFPGAISNTSGLAVMMEIARAVANQESLPYETIVFIGFNGQQRQNAGSEYYLENPLYPIDKTSIIHLEDLGAKTIDGLKVSSESIVSRILRDKVVSYAEDAELDVYKTGPFPSPSLRFADFKAPGIMLSDEIFAQNNYEDTFNIVDQASLENAGLVVMNYLKRETYHDIGIDYLNPGFIIILLILSAVVFLNTIIARLYKVVPNKKMLGHSYETIYYSSPIMILRRGIEVILPVAITLFMLVFIANIDPGLRISNINNQTESNFSLYLALKNSLNYFQNFFSLETTTAGGASIARTIISATRKSLLLMLSALLVSVVIGITRGLYEGYRSKNKNLNSLGTLIVFSIPDVLIVILGLMLYVLIAQNIKFLEDVSFLKKFILPFITLSILPTIYISRITYITVQEEIKLEYIMNAKAKGLSRRHIFTSELLPPVSFRIIDSLPAIMTMRFSNMIIVEYLFNYLGLMNYLIYFYNRQDINGFIAIAVTMGTIYVLLTWGIQFLAGLVNPLKRRRVK